MMMAPTIMTMPKRSPRRSVLHPRLKPKPLTMQMILPLQHQRSVADPSRKRRMRSRMRMQQRPQRKSEADLPRRLSIRKRATMRRLPSQRRLVVRRLLLKLKSLRMFRKKRMLKRRKRLPSQSVVARSRLHLLTVRPRCQRRGRSSTALSMYPRANRPQGQEEEEV